MIKARMTKIMCGTKFESDIWLLPDCWLTFGVNTKNRMKNMGRRAPSRLYSSGLCVLLDPMQMMIHMMTLTMIMKEP